VGPNVTRCNGGSLQGLSTLGCSGHGAVGRDVFWRNRGEVIGSLLQPSATGATQLCWRT